MPVEELSRESLFCAPESDKIATDLYHAIRGSSDHKTLYLLWQLRLNHLFQESKLVARREGTNLAEAIHLLVRLGVQEPETQVPLKNEASETPFGLQLSLLRVKYTTATAFSIVNEYYKMVYRVRLSLIGALKEQRVMEVKKVSILCYGVLSILVVKREFGAAIGLVSSVLSNHIKALHDQSFEENLRFLHLLLILLESKASGLPSIKPLEASGLNKNSQRELWCVLENIAAIYSSDEDQNRENLVVQKAQLANGGLGAMDIVLAGQALNVDSQLITGRILCSLLGMWELMLRYNVEMKEAGVTGWNFDALCDIFQPSDFEPEIAVLHALVAKRWFNEALFNKVYGFE
ncbi:hypothetical protein BABINDRAFT_167347 [Babjeviella inositovora NRRL Y-12698]|uniref:Uncharacterized protein n=1 Tax=Babjeviella inositovora NRRL Y-12698 TaxID=984486 RepID=A0A1E3QPB1_9ASCO|nr:uncharacterized protein BABINDRAFT_167347 [Babjeviella inositovora NRRL Y-12698]ODQ79490.1 hypothetical protein BABINDRAFT_167347 [Babjeviella inositovora NRRL Y-12698]